MRVGIVGVGAMGQNHARIYSEEAELVGICDTDVALGREVAKRVRATFHPSHDDLFQEELDAVSIATPTTLHHDIARDALAAGLHVLLEKPFTGTSALAEELAQQADDSGLVLAAGMVERHNPSVAFVHRALQDAEYGDIITIASRRVSAFPTRVRDVGVMMDLGVHDIDVMRYLVGAEPRRVYGVAGRERHEAYEDHATALLTFANGVDGFVEANWLTPMKVRNLSLTCQRNFVEVDYIEQSLEISSSSLGAYDPSNLYQAPFEYDVRQVALERQEPLKREIGDFLEAVRKPGRPLVDGHDVAQTLRVVEAIQTSCRKREPVDLT